MPNLDLHHLGNVGGLARDHKGLRKLEPHDASSDVHSKNPNGQPMQIPPPMPAPWRRPQRRRSKPNRREIIMAAKRPDPGGAHLAGSNLRPCAPRRTLDPQLPRDVWLLQVGGAGERVRERDRAPVPRHLPAQRPRDLARDRGARSRRPTRPPRFASGFVAGALSDRIGPRACSSAALVVMAVATALPADPRAVAGVRAERARRAPAAARFWPSQSTLLVAR